MEQDLATADLLFSVVRSPLYTRYESEQFAKDLLGQEFKLPDRLGLFRDDTGDNLGIVSPQFILEGHQPREQYAFMEKYFHATEDWEPSSMGSLRGGKEIWFAARYKKDFIVAGAAHRRYALLSNAYDATQAGRCQGTTTNVVCNNTLRAAHAGSEAVVKRPHSMRFIAEEVAAELAQVNEGLEHFKVIGDNLALAPFKGEDLIAFFKKIAGIDLKITRDQLAADTERKLVSTRKLNIYTALWGAYQTTLTERGGEESAFTALNAVTRYVDHSRTVKNDSTASRVQSATFGSGDQMKGQAMGLLMPLIKDKVAVVA